MVLLENEMKILEYLYVHTHTCICNILALKFLLFYTIMLWHKNVTGPFTGVFQDTELLSKDVVGCQPQRLPTVLIPLLEVLIVVFL